MTCMYPPPIHGIYDMHVSSSYYRQRERETDTEYMTCMYPPPIHGIYDMHVS
jgi:hypothetical protein